MYKLYYSPGACSMAIHVLLNELNAQYTLEKVAIPQGDNRKPEFLKLNPRGQVPVLVEGNHVMREGAAILAYLCDKHGALLPKDGPARAEALEWLMFCNSTMHPAYSRGFMMLKNKDVQGSETFLKMTVDYINKLWAEVEERLATRSYLCGEQMTVADILLTVIANWSPRFPEVTLGPKTKALLQRVSQRPSYQKAMATEQTEYKMAS
jgi:glutathione S-transferase